MSINPIKTTIDRAAVRSQWISWILEREPTHLFDFNPNIYLTPEAIRSICSTVHYEYDKAVARALNTQITEIDRTYAVFALEEAGGRLHVHSRWRLPTDDHVDVARRMFGSKRPAVLKKLLKNNALTATFQSIHNRSSSISYCLKNVTRDDLHPERLFSSDEFFA